MNEENSTVNENKKLQEEIQRLISKYALAMATILGCAAEEAIEESQAKNYSDKRRNNRYTEEMIAEITAEVKNGSSMYAAMMRRSIPIGSHGFIRKKVLPYLNGDPVIP